MEVDSDPSKGSVQPMPLLSHQLTMPQAVINMPSESQPMPICMISPLLPTVVPVKLFFSLAEGPNKQDLTSRCPALPIHDKYDHTIPRL